nr:MAG TPA: hypothetical protein [Caudoviricetes sp.]
MSRVFCKFLKKIFCTKRTPFSPQAYTFGGCFACKIGP